MTVSVVLIDECRSHTMSYVPAVKVILKTFRPTSGTPVYLSTPVPEMWKLWIVPSSLTINL